jgi:hypothetical protein
VGCQLDGHHLAVNVTSLIIVTIAPTFLGAEPAIIPSGRHAGWDVLGGESTKDLLFATRSRRSDPVGRACRSIPEEPLYRTGPRGAELQQESHH